MKAIVIGILASFFFAFTFVLNRAMDLEGGSWIWSASLRYYFMVPMLLLIVMYRGNLKQLFQYMKNNPKEWLVWSIVGFGLFMHRLVLLERSDQVGSLHQHGKLQSLQGFFNTIFAVDPLHKNFR